MKSPPAGQLCGHQTPRVHCYPGTAVDYDAGDSALALADVAGRDMPPWQCAVVREGMAKRADGKWAASEVGVLASRQNGKNGSIEVVELWWLINEPGISVLHTAHEAANALDAMDRLLELLKADPLLEAEIAPRGIRQGNGKEAIKFANGSIIRFRTRTKKFGRGFSVDRLVIDEAMIYSPAAMAALEPMLTTADKPGATGPGPQTWYLGSAADADTHEYSGQWTSIRTRALEGGDGSLLWLEWSAPDPPPATDRVARAAWRSDRAHWAAANPSLGYLLTEDYIANEQKKFRNNIEKWEVERLGCGRWPRVTDEGDHVFNTDERDGGEVWAAMAYETRPTLVGDIAFGVAMSDDRKWLTIAAAQYTAEGQRHLEVGYHEAPTPAAADRLVALILRMDPCAVMMRAAGQAKSMRPALIKAQLEPEEITARDYVAACGQLYDDAVNGLLSHSDDPRLNAAVNGATATNPGSAWLEQSGAPISPLEAATCALRGLVLYGGLLGKPQGPAGDPGYVEENDLDLFSTAF